MNHKEILQAKKTTGVLAILSFLSGIFFINKPVTGNIISTNYYPLNYFSLVGLLLIVCSIILGKYSLKK